jgi:2-dehydro-3-deoxyphosphogluconate aldolase/(4S)-4-hydroxy-2-oxoglutarate aldolase
MPVDKTVHTLLKDGFILVFNQDRLDVLKTAQSLSDAGIGNMEVTCRIKRPLEKISRLRTELPDFAVGAASLIDQPQVLKTYNAAHPEDPLPSAEQAVEAGATYIVSAGNFRPQTYDKLRGRAAIIPGCGSVTEILSQFALGANFCKLFPARQLGGPAFVKAIDPAIHKTVSLVPTGGTSAENIPDYVAAGVLVVGGSFSAIDKAVFKEIVERQDYKLLAAELRKIKKMIDDCRRKTWPGIDLVTASVEDVSGITGRCFNLDSRS